MYQAVSSSCTEREATFLIFKILLHRGSALFYCITVLLSGKRICRCCSNRHLGHPHACNIRSSQSPGHRSNPSCMSLKKLEKGNLLQPSPVSTRESENCWPGLGLPWIICCNCEYSQLWFCDAAHSSDQRPPSGSQCTVCTASHSM